MNGPDELDRRSMLARVLWVAGAAATASVSPEAFAREAAAARPYLDKPVFDLLSAVADTMVPRTDTAGAIDAHVPRLFEALLVNWASGDRRYQLTRALSGIDRAATARLGKGFTALSAEQRHDFLTEYDKQALRPTPGPALSGTKALTAEPRVVDPGYGRLKELIVLLYYLSEPALTQELSYVHVPGKWEPSVPVTPATRPSAGTLF